MEMKLSFPLRSALLYIWRVLIVALVNAVMLAMLRAPL